MLRTVLNITCLNKALVVVVFFKLGNEEDHKTEVCQIWEQQKERYDVCVMLLLLLTS